MPPPRSLAIAEESFELRDLRERFGLAQREVADAMGTSQPAVLKVERASDPQWSTLRRYVEALGEAAGAITSLEVVAIIDGNRFELTPPKGLAMQHSPGGTATVAGSATFWRLRAWDDATLEERFLRESLISMSADEIGDVTVWPGTEELRGRLKKGTKDRGDQAIGLFIRYWDYFRNHMTPGDVVVVPLLGRRAAIGVITGDYEYRPAEPEPRIRHVRTVDWVRTIERASLPDRIRKVVNAPGTICRINDDAAGEYLLTRAS